MIAAFRALSTACWSVEPSLTMVGFRVYEDQSCDPQVRTRQPQPLACGLREVTLLVDDDPFTQRGTDHRPQAPATIRLLPCRQHEILR